MKNIKKTPTAMVLKPGFGSSTLHLGQTEAEVKAILGKPESCTRKYEGQYFFNYPLRGLQVDFGVQGGVVTYIFYFRDGVRRNCQANVLIEGGIAPGDTKEKVLARMGEPNERGEPVTLHSGIRFGEWFHYDAGITFEFGDDGKVDMVTITAASDR